MRNKQKLIQLAYESSLLYAKDFPGEPFHQDYTKNPDLFRRLIKSDRRTETGFNKYFKGLAERVTTSGIRWIAYQTKVQTAAEIDDYITVDWDEEVLNMKVILTDSLVDAIVAGGKLMEEESKIALGWNESAPSVIDFIDKYGLKESKILNKTTIEKVKSALKLSINNQEPVDRATKRIMDVIDDPARSATIARTESVQAFGAGRRAVADEIGWNYKEWHNVLGACIICLTNADQGRIPKEQNFKESDTEGEPAHPNCRCSVRYYKDKE